MQASSVFNSLLSPRFKEGTELDALGTVEIPLPDDDPEAMRTACRVIHGQASEVSDQPSLEALTTLALLSDKYDLARSMHDLAEHWISRLRQQFMLPEGRRDLLQSAYYFEQDGWFAEIGRKILTGDVKNVPGGQEVKPFVGPAADRLDAALSMMCPLRVCS